MIKKINKKEIKLIMLGLIILSIFLIIYALRRNVINIIDIESTKEMETGTNIHVEVYDNSQSKVKTVLIITNPVGISEIIVGDNIVNGNGKKSIGIDFARTMNDSIYVKVKDMNNSVITKSVDISQDDIDSKIGITDNTSTDNLNKDISMLFNNQLSTNGVKQYYKIGETNIWQEYTSGDLVFTAYYAKVHNYLNQDNTITIYGKIEDTQGNVVINSKKCLIDSSVVGMQIIPNTPVKASNVSTFPNLEVKDASGEEIKGIIVQFTSSIVAGDKITLNSASGFTAQNGTSYVYVPTAGKTLADIQAYLRANLSITAYNSVQVKFSIGTMTFSSIIPYCAYTNHYYEYVAAPGITWANAKIAAENRTYLGVNRIFSYYNKYRRK